MPDKRPKVRWRVSMIVVLVCACLTLASPVGALQSDEDCYPDGCTTPTNPEPPDEPGCNLSLETAQSGTIITATVRSVPDGSSTEIRFAGRVVARSEDLQGLRSLSRGGLLDDLVLTFQVPDVAPGTYSVVAVGDTFTITCGSGNGFAVLATGVAGDDEGNANSGGSGAGGLAFTGATVLSLLAIAMSLLALGTWFIRQARRRRSLTL